MSSSSCQPAILLPAPSSGRFLTFALRAGESPGPALKRLAQVPHDEHVVLGLGTPVVGNAVPDLRPFPSDLSLFPSTQSAVWAFLAHPDRGAAFDAARGLARTLGPSFEIEEEVDSFRYRGGRDLSGFEDGTENPKGDQAILAAIVRGRGPGLDGGSFVAVERWVHDLDAIDAMPVAVREAAVGRHQVTNEEIPDAPASAHVKRTAQESFDPPAFILRRSMPYGGIAEHGLYFVAYGESLDRFERQLRRMAGRDDGVLDGILSFSRAVTGGYYFCPPLHEGRLDLRAIAL
jgi:putative iron-dependent peroxidase